ncbi:hypothetical protein VCR5J5_740018 [Vibrio crassostreae]|uniref:Uncharacterized protein n=1 Tax=Vibrio crassostreae TaxID=246167 RepID=A0A822N6K2_9VIBR|nr:hypothetical protein VCR5J5_740018 [Vibrio crassostreae]
MVSILLAYWLIGLLAYWLIGLLAYWLESFRYEIVVRVRYRLNKSPNPQ